MPLFLPKFSAMGIDLSDLSIKVANLKKGSSQKMILESLGDGEIPKSFINDGIVDPEKESEVAQIIKETINRARGKKINTRKAICSLPEESSFLKIIKVPRGQNEEMEEILKWQIESNFPVKLKDVYFDWEIIEPNENKKTNSKKSNQEKSVFVSVAVIPRRIVNSYFSLFKKAGIEPIVFEIESMAAVRSLIGGYAQGPVIVLDIGKCGSGLTIFSKNTIFFTSHIEISGQLFNEAIARSLGVEIERAEELKKEIGLLAIGKEKNINLNLKKSKPTISTIEDIRKKNKSEIKIDIEKGSEVDEVFNALVPILTDFSEQVQRYIDYFKNLEKTDFTPNGKIEKILLCGGDSKLIGLSDFLFSSLKIETQLGNPLINVFSSKKIAKNPSFWDFLPYTTAIGLAKRGILF